jgi:STIP1 homology and U-box containing protein 1
MSLSSSNKWKEEGNKLFLKRNYKEAIEMYTKALEKSTNSLYYTNRALCYFKLGQWTSTMEDCRKAIELDCRSVKGHFFLGI